MKIVVEGEAKEIAALVVALQERRGLQEFIDRPLSEVLRTLGLSKDDTREAFPAQ